MFPSFTYDTPFYPVICVSASRFDEFNGRTGYVQGSGDDHELWGMVSVTKPCSRQYLMQ